MRNDVTHIIADTYQIIRQIGSGGGGTVYLAEHLRLNKKVVLKADKRDLSTNKDVLRREVDALKDLSHTYIPQVYDFIAEDGIVYTVMDYIEGDSFDKPLKRGDRFSQASVIEWACQLLSALNYLHSRPPHGILHADIKPSNVMLTPEGDIRLIDFNIALALGEEGAVAVGRSFGYASPEHYGIEYSVGSVTRGINTDIATDLSDKSLSYIETILETKHEPGSSSSTSGKKKIMLDVRSDIYSLGATLYHIMTGNRPAQNALAVAPISNTEYSPVITTIVSKAMNPNPDLRYQSAKEMLFDFEHLWDNDPRIKRNRRVTFAATSILVLLFLFGGFSALLGQRKMGLEQRMLAEEHRVVAEEQRQLSEEQGLLAEEQRQLARLNEAYALAEYSANALRGGDADGAVENALQALNNATIPEAQKALADALGVYDLSDGFKPYKALSAGSEIIKTALSPDGGIAAVLTLGTLLIIDTATGEITSQLPVVESALSDAVFLSNSTLVYAGAEGITTVDLASRTALWSSKIATTIAVSDDGTYIAAVNRADSTASIYDSNGELLKELDLGGKSLRVVTNDRLGDPRDNLFSLSSDGVWLAVSFSDGALWVFNTLNSNDDLEILDPSDYTHFEGGFNKRYFAFSATSATESLFAVIDVVNLAETISTVLPSRISVAANENGIYMSYNGTHVRIDPLSAVQTPIKSDSAEISAGDYKLQSNIDSQILHILKYEEHSEREAFAYDPSYLHDEARFDANIGTVMLFSIDGFRLYSIDGALISEQALAEPNNIYDQQYRRPNGEAYLEIIYYDGRIVKYSAVDGQLLSTQQGSPPDESLYEEFITDTIKIASPLHGTPIAYDLSTGKLIRELESNDYLTYVTQVGDYLITEYISAAAGSRYGLLLDAKTCETLALLPGLCDVIGEHLFFDMPNGSIRETQIYALPELINLAK